MSKWISVKKRLPKENGYYLVCTRLGNPYHLATFYEGTFTPWYELLLWTSEERRIERHIVHLKEGFNKRIVAWIPFPRIAHELRYPNESK